MNNRNTSNKASGHSTLPFRSCTYRKLAEFYGVCTRTIKRWLEPFEHEIGPKLGWYFTPKQAAIIFDKLITYTHSDETP